VRAATIRLRQRAACPEAVSAYAVEGADVAKAPPWKSLIELGMNFAEPRRAQVRKLVAELVDQGQLARSQTGAAVDDILELGRRRTKALRAVVRKEVRHQLKALGVTVPDDSAAKKTAAKKPAAKKTAAKKTAAKKTAAKKPAAKKTAAKKTAAKKPAAK
jgi:polyhydroxyalkanoate synthesis regulator phasin